MSKLKAEKITGFKHQLLPSFSFTWITLITLYAILHFLAASNQTLYFYSGGDNATYFLLGQAIVQGQGYTDFYADPPSPHVKYPFVFPVMIAVMMFFFGENILFIKIMIATCAVVMVLFTALLWKNRDPSALSLLTTVLVTTMPFTLSLSAWVMSDIPFMAFICVSLFLIEHAFTAGSLRTMSFYGSIFFMLCACLTRGVGIVLGPALIMAIFFHPSLRTKWRQKFIMATTIIIPFCMATMTWYYVRPTLLQTADNSYVQEFFKNADRPEMRVDVNQFSDLIKRILFNQEYYLQSIGDVLRSFSPTFSFQIRYVAGSIIVLIFFTGLIIMFRKSRGAPEFFTLFYILLIMVWSGHDSRFLVPLYPFSIYYFLKGLEYFIQKALWWTIPVRKNSLTQGGIIVMTLIMLSTNFISNFKTYQNVSRTRQSELCVVNPWFTVEPLDQLHCNLLNAVRALSTLLKTGDIILSRKEPLVTLISKAPVKTYPEKISPDDFIRFLTLNKIKYLIVDEFDHRIRRGVFSTLLAHPDSLHFVMRVENTMIYLFEPYKAETEQERAF
ncbi:ArnT family glycosyltransferase [candidate division CSSED10-310 bacterium]|uniref:ArnT family glycosyltransferase n=1 Tax=candidate division CSSED10-310 bacterium TaxID=2855610 RepID=A0ABV6YTP9_UNCC1